MERNNIIKYPLPWYKRIHFTCILITVSILLIMFMLCSSTSHAEELTTHSYSLSYRRVSAANSNDVESLVYSIKSDYPIATYMGKALPYCYYNGAISTASFTYSRTGYTYIDDEIGTITINDNNLNYPTNSFTVNMYKYFEDNKGSISSYTLSSSIPNFSTYEDMEYYLLTGDDSSRLNKPSIDVETPDHKDFNYTLLGFKANKDITATWTGTTERTKLTEVTPYEYVHAYIGYAYKNAPGQIAKRVEYDEFFPMEDYTATIDWNSIQSDDDTIFLRYVQFYPMYSDTEGFFGTFIYGNPSTIWFRNDGTIESVESNGIMNYDFTTDTIHTEIPLPEISNISHRGFTIENLGEYYVDVMVNTYLYGVKLIAPYGMGAVSATDYATKPDKTWIYDQDFYQPSLHSDVAINQANIDIERDFGIDTITPMINAFKRWSITYPHVKQLPDYTWQMVGCQTQYNDTHVYKQDSQMTDFEQLVKSGQATTVFYVRFYNDKGQTGQWVKYTYSDGFGSLENGGITDGTIASGAVDVDSNGNVHINESNGYVDENGNITYPVFGTDTGIGADITLNGFKDTLEEFVSAVGNIPEYISKLFGFLPWWCTALIGLAIGAVVILRFLGR